MSDIVAIEITHHQLPLDPPFPASWDPQPRTKFPVTIVRVRDSDGREGVGSGDVMYGFADYARYFIGQPAGDLDRHAAVLANIEFHAGRRGRSIWRCGISPARPPTSRCGGCSGARRRVCGSTRPAASADRSQQMVEMAERVVDAGSRR